MTVGPLASNIWKIPAFYTSFHSKHIASKQRKRLRMMMWRTQQPVNDTAPNPTFPVQSLHFLKKPTNPFLFWLLELFLNLQRRTTVLWISGVEMDRFEDPVRGRAPRIHGNFHCGESHRLPSISELRFAVLVFFLVGMFSHAGKIHIMNSQLHDFILLPIYFFSFFTRLHTKNTYQIGASANSRRDSECQGGRLIICWPTWAAATQIDFQRINVRPALMIVFSVLI